MWRWLPKRLAVQLEGRCQVGTAGRAIEACDHSPGCPRGSGLLRRRHLR